eukprot:3796163-Prymnesium_polylepis.2
MLFTGPVHNLLLESLVSRKAELERIHRGSKPETLDHVFLYRARQATAREASLTAEMRSGSDGARRALSVAKAATGKALSGSANRSRSQMLRLCSQTEAYAQGLSTEHLLKRGSHGIAKRRRQARADHQDNRAAVATARPRRAKPLAAEGCCQLLPATAAPFAQGAKQRGNIFKNKAVIQAGKAALKARAQQSAALKAQHHGRQKPLNRRTERLAASKPAGVRVGQRAPASRQSQRAAAAAAASAIDADSDQDKEDDSDEEDGSADGGDDEYSDLEGELDDAVDMDVQRDGGDGGEGADDAGDDESGAGEASEVADDDGEAEDRAPRVAVQRSSKEYQPVGPALSRGEWAPPAQCGPALSHFGAESRVHGHKITVGTRMRVHMAVACGPCECDL